MSRAASFSLGSFVSSGVRRRPEVRPLSVPVMVRGREGEVGGRTGFDGGTGPETLDVSKGWTRTDSGMSV